MNTQTLEKPRLHAGAAVFAGLIAGAVFMVLEMILVPMLMGGTPWGPPRMIAAIAMGPDVLPPPATFDLGIMLVAMMVHFALSIVLALVFALIAKGRPMGTAIMIGAVFGLVVYLVAFYVMTAFFPWFAEARNWLSLLLHVIFGAVLGWVYAMRTARFHR